MTYLYLSHKTYFVGVISPTIKLFRPYQIDIVFHRQNSPKFLTQVTGKKKKNERNTYATNFAVCSHLYFFDDRPLLSSMLQYSVRQQDKLVTTTPTTVEFTFCGKNRPTGSTKYEINMALIVSDSKRINLYFTKSGSMFELCPLLPVVWERS